MEPYKIEQQQYTGLFKVKKKMKNSWLLMGVFQTLSGAEEFVKNKLHYKIIAGKK